MPPTRRAYLDASALLKLVVEETESADLQRHMADWPRQMSSAIVEVELLRAVGRGRSDSRSRDRASEVLANIVLLELDSTVRRAAAVLEPATLRSLDAIHLATALTLGSDLAAFVTYDRRLFAAAVAAGLTALAPGQTAVS